MSPTFARQPPVDVEFAIDGEPSDPSFPRFANVVSHRVHVVRIIIKPRRLTAGATGLNLIAHIVSHGPDTVGQSEDVFCGARIWGGARTVRPIPLDAPLIFIDVPITPDDDHLGQGPYDAYVTVSPFVPDDVVDAVGGDSGQTAEGEQGREENTTSSLADDTEPDSGPIPVVTGQTFCVSFVSM